MFENYQSNYYHIKDFKFDNGQILADLKLHYLTMGSPIWNSAGQMTNAVLLLHNTTGNSKTWLQPSLGGELFGSSQALDLSKYFIIIPDAIGFGKSSKPSDGMRASFPNYRYSDIVRSIKMLLTEKLEIQHLHLILGISMGGMLAWMWAGQYPEFTDAIIAVACQPGPMSGRNWIHRRIAIEAIRNDPKWFEGNYTENPSYYVYTAPYSALLTHSVKKIQERAPTRKDSDKFYIELVNRARKIDANNRLYQIEASMDYDPSAYISAIKAKMLLINFADDQLNPPELDIIEPVIQKIPDARFVLVPASCKTQGHGSNSIASIWKHYLEEFLSSPI